MKKMLPFGEDKATFEAFVEKISEELNKIDTNKLLPTEYEFQYFITKIIQEEIDKKTNKAMNELVINLERERIDIVIFYYPKNEDSFAEIIELKRGGGDGKDRDKR